ncbi:GIY-YIG nuclease family protein [Pseudomonas akapageensis]|uniref:GIY-YIG nuclease family protein n=1 Tax=Pseudomonas akapageensis TaxID=2609961 RepID=UPI0014073CE2|nr:GIY-YIG nuclease family protein [Pseudomonas akapageensis]
MVFFKELEFDLPSALLKELVALFDQMESGPLNDVAVETVSEDQGVYQLLFRGELVYIGKTDADAGLRQRLLRHSKKIRSRMNLDQSEVSFKVVRVYVFTAMDLEELLIKHYKSSSIPLSWNFSGFGSNDPGRNRDKSKVKASHFDRLYPIDLNVEVCVLQQESSYSVAEVLKQMKEQLAYTVRFQGQGERSKKPHQDLVERKVVLRKEADSVLSIL